MRIVSQTVLAGFPENPQPTPSASSTPACRRRRAWSRVGCLHRFARETCLCTGWNQSPPVSGVPQAGDAENRLGYYGPNPAPGRPRTRFSTPRGKGTAHQSSQCGQVGPIITLGHNNQPEQLRILLCSWRHCGVAVEGDAMKKIAAPIPVKDDRLPIRRPSRHHLVVAFRHQPLWSTAIG
jgi:hypothetical protein